MLEEILLKDVDKFVKSGLIQIKKENSRLYISSEKGTLSVGRCKNINSENDILWQIGYFSLDLEDKETAESVFQGNEILNKWYNEYLKTLTKKEGYIIIPLYDSLLKFEDAWKVSLYLLTKMLPTQNIQNKNLN